MTEPLLYSLGGSFALALSFFLGLWHCCILFSWALTGFLPFPEASLCIRNLFWTLLLCSLLLGSCFIWGSFSPSSTFLAFRGLFCNHSLSECWSMFAFCLRLLCVLWMSFKLSTILSSLQLICVLGDPCNFFPWKEILSGSQNHFSIIWGFSTPFSVLILFWRIREDWGRWGGGRGEESFHKWNSFKSPRFQLQ